MGVESTPFWTNLFAYSHEEEYMSSLISPNKTKAKHLHSTMRFIDKLCVRNYGGEFGRSFCDISKGAWTEGWTSGWSYYGSEIK